MNTEAPRPRRVSVLGSTGSIGRQAIEVISAHPESFELVALVAGSDGPALQEQVARTGARFSGLGADAAQEAATLEDVDVVLNAIVGAAGLRASVAALEAGKTLALANKESLVAGGEVCTRAVERGEGRIVPVDSEHAALAQCLRAVAEGELDRIVLTASGGPFRDRADLSAVTLEDALAHPTWSMGPKITVDSATLMNKGLEVIEAHWLFGVGFDRIDVLVHPQSIVHAMVHLVDGSSVMQAAPTDMRIPIQAALSWPDRLPSSFEPVDLARIGSLQFEGVDHERFPAVGFAYKAGRLGRSYPAALNAANEEAVGAFLRREIGFTDIPALIDRVLGAHDPFDASDLDAVLEADAWTRREAAKALSRRVAGATS